MRMLINVLKGTVIGIANAIPGVSGGTMMVSMGVYDKVIDSVTGLFSHFKESVKTLFPYLLGMLIGIAGLSFGITYMLQNFPFQTSLLFIGLILGGLPPLVSHINKEGSFFKNIRIVHVVLFLLAFGLIIGLQILGKGSYANQVLVLNPQTIVVLFLIGILAAATMVIPGVSGSMILMILGYYYPVLNAIKEFIKALATFEVNKMLQTAGLLVPFGIGVLVGIFAIAKAVDLLLLHFETHTYSVIFGLVIASPVAIFLCNGIGSMTLLSIVTGILCLAAGLTIAWFLGRE